MKYHLYAHNTANFVKKGDKVVQYVTPIGSIGTANGEYYAHLHFSISEGLTVAQLKAYVSGWKKEKVLQFYKDPRGVDFTKMFGKKVDVGNFGYDWLQWIGYGYHPGVDVNGLTGGNTDIGMPFKASCNGTVIHVDNTTAKNGWGKLVIVEESEPEKPVVNDNNITMIKEFKDATELLTGKDFGKELTEGEQLTVANDIVAAMNYARKSDEAMLKAQDEKAAAFIKMQQIEQENAALKAQLASCVDSKVTQQTNIMDAIKKALGLG